MDTEKLIERLRRKAYRREEWLEPQGTVDVPCYADDHGAEAYFINPDGPAAADALEASTRRVKALEDALAPSGDTKAAYMGEFAVPVTMSHPRLGSETRMIDVPWTTIKEIMAAIRERANRVSQEGL